MFYFILWQHWSVYLNDIRRVSAILFRHPGLEFYVSVQTFCSRESEFHILMLDALDTRMYKLMKHPTLLTIIFCRYIFLSYVPINYSFHSNPSFGSFLLILFRMLFSRRKWFNNKKLSYLPLMFMWHILKFLIYVNKLDNLSYEA